jgi:hypothetical protein
MVWSLEGIQQQAAGSAPVMRTVPLIFYLQLQNISKVLFVTPKHHKVLFATLKHIKRSICNSETYQTFYLPPFCLTLTLGMTNDCDRKYS